MSDLNYYDDNMTVEWINDIKYMSPSPHPNHGMVYKKIFNKIANYLEGKECELFPDKTVTVCFNDEESIFSFQDEVKVNIFSDLTICLKDVKLFEV